MQFRVEAYGRSPLAEVKRFTPFIFYTYFYKKLCVPSKKISKPKVGVCVCIHVHLHST